MKIIVLDAGHGGKDSGAVRYGLLEKDVNRKTVDFIIEELKNYSGILIRETRPKDETVDLLSRRHIIATSKASIAISFHCNSVTDSKANGYETFRRFEHSLPLQRHIHTKVINFLKPYKIVDRTMKTGEFIILNTNVPSILVENLFISNAREADLLKSDDFLKKLAKVYAEGITEYLKVSRKPGGGDKPLDVK